jgi:hypothetical protein
MSISPCTRRLRPRVLVPFLILASFALIGAMAIAPGAASSDSPTPSSVVNLSVRGPAGAGNDRLIMGFALAGPGKRTVVVRGVGPGLQGLVTDELNEPVLTLFRREADGKSTRLDGNTAWGDGPDAGALAVLTEQFGLLPLAQGSRDTALLHEASGGSYTAHVASGSGEIGIALGIVTYYVTNKLGRGARVIRKEFGGSPALRNNSSRTIRHSSNPKHASGYQTQGTKRIYPLRSPARRPPRDGRSDCRRKPA